MGNASVPSEPREISCGRMFGEVVRLGGRLESDEMDGRLLDGAGGGMLGKNEVDRSDDGVISSITAAPDCGFCWFCWRCCSWAC